MERTPGARPRWRTGLVLLGIAGALAVPAEVLAQELEPRAYSASPIGANFALLGYSWSGGQVLVDESLPVSNVESRIGTLIAGYSRTFGLAGRASSLAVTVPWVWGTMSGDVGETRRTIERVGSGDVRLRWAVNLLGGPALSPAEFAKWKQRTTLGASLSVVAPTGEYDATKLVNIGSNRWSFKPELGVSIPLGNWFVEASAGVWLFTDNDEFFGGLRREQDPLALLQLHGGYQFRPGFWIAADANYYRGGSSTVGGIAKDDLQANSRYGLTLSVRLAPGLSAKLATATGLTTRTGADYNTVLLAVQYLWIDR
jgi:hypothetical protein